MNIMKKKPELLKRSGKSSLTLRNFLNNLKENDLHYENKQITQCVFLGVLRLKPVPSAFSYNVPSCSGILDNSKSKKSKNDNSNKEQNKNTSKNINKVFTGNVTKKNPQKVKEAVKKVPNKNSHIKIKLNTQKKTSKDNAETSTSSSKQHIVPFSVPGTVSPNSIIASTTITIQPIMSPTKFNPVQNLFDKLKQQRLDESYSEPGPSGTTPPPKLKDNLKLAPVKYKVCKINANGPDTNDDTTSKSPKKSLTRKSYKHTSVPLVSTSPITISDSESNSKKDKDEVILLEDNTDNKITDDIIVINDDEKHKGKGKIYPKKKRTLLSQDMRKKKYLSDEHRSKQVIHAFPITVQTEDVYLPGVIDITDGSNPKDYSNTENQQQQKQIIDKQDVIIIDEVREVRVSPRLKKIEEKAKENNVSLGKSSTEEVLYSKNSKNELNINEILADNVLNKSVDISKTQQLNITVDSIDIQRKDNGKEKTTPKLLKIAGIANKNTPTVIKSEITKPETLSVSEKPKRRKNSIISTTLLPPMLLNAPMLLRSEMAPKKTNYTSRENVRIRKSKDKTNKSFKMDPGKIKNKIKNTSSKLLDVDSKDLLLPKQECCNSDYLPNIKISHSFEEQQSNEKCEDLSFDAKNEEIYVEKEIMNRTAKEFHKEIQNHTVHANACSELHNEAITKDDDDDDIVIVNQEENALQKQNGKAKEIVITQKNKVSESSIPVDKDERIIREEYLEEIVSPRFLRSGLCQQKIDNVVLNKEADITIDINDDIVDIESLDSPIMEKPVLEVIEQVNIVRNVVSPRTLRSDLHRQKEPQLEPMENIVKEPQIPVLKEKVSPKLSPISQKLKGKLKTVDLDEIIILDEADSCSKQDESSKSLLQPEFVQSKEDSVGYSEEEVILIQDEPKQKQKSSSTDLKSNTGKISSTDTSDVLKNLEKSDVFDLNNRRSEKLSPEIVPPKRRSPRNLKMENISTSVIAEQSETSRVRETLEPLSNEKHQLQSPSRRLLRSEAVQKNSDSVNNANSDIITSPRVLRSERTPQMSPENVVKQKLPGQKMPARKRSPQKSLQILESEVNSVTILQQSTELEIIQNVKLENFTSPKTKSNVQMEKQTLTLSASPMSKRNSKNVLPTRQPELLSSSKKKVARKNETRLLKNKTKNALLTSNVKLNTPMLLRSELAKLKNIAEVKPAQKRVSKKNKQPETDNSIVENENSPLDLGNSKKRKKSRRGKKDSTQTLCAESETAISVDGKSQTGDVILNTENSTDKISELSGNHSVAVQDISNNQENVVDSGNLQEQDISLKKDESRLKTIKEEPPIKVEVAQKRRSLHTRKGKRTDKCNVQDISNDQEIVIGTEGLQEQRTSPKKNATTVETIKVEPPTEVETVVKRKSVQTRKGKRKQKTETTNTCNVQEISNGQEIVMGTEELQEQRTSPKKNATTVETIKVEPPTEVETVVKRKSVQTRKGKRKQKVIKELEDIQKEVERLLENQDARTENVFENRLCDVASKKGDITVFDFDESEDEVLPLRLNSPKRDKLMTSTTNEHPTDKITPKTRQEKAVNQSLTKAQTKAKLLNSPQEEPTQKNNENIPSKPKKENSTKTKSNKQSVKHPNMELSQPVKAKKRGRPRKIPQTTNIDPSSTPQELSTTPKSKSPLKQTTITDMFSKVELKKEKSSIDSIFDSPPKDNAKVMEPQQDNGNVNTETTMLPPATDTKPLPPLTTNGVENDVYDDDSDCDSRMEWIPEEYAEYKFKYSAKKMMTHKPIHKCKICLLVLPTYYKLSKHREEHIKKENPYSCRHCDQEFSNIEDLTAHLRIHKGKHPYTCKKCDKGFWSKKALDAHTPIHVLKKIKQPNKRFRCDVCAKEFSKLCDMERHTRVHTGEKPCVCNICNKRFQQSHNLSKHLLTHLHVKPFHCEICNKQFGRNDVLNRHLLTHSVEKPIKCPLCPKGFIRQTQLNNHMKNNHMEASIIRVEEPSVVEAT